MTANAPAHDAAAIAHTPGRWEVQSPMDHELWVVEAGKEAYEWRVIAGLPWPDERKDIPRKQVEANANLIAAAPCLHAVVQRFIAALEGEAVDYDELAASARSALSQAKGE